MIRQIIIENYKSIHKATIDRDAIGIGTILERCPRFRVWVERLISACSYE
ncbi:hypothetical protein [uncultured Porphyromonas sp.]|nr:hypothetical protein [uncultured Porphyromonas sp.]